MRCIVRALAGFFPWIFHEYNQARIFGLDLCVLAGSFLPPAVARDQICLFWSYAPQFFAWGHAFIGSILLSPFSFSSGIFLCSHHNFTYFIYHVTAERPKVIKDKPDLTFGEVGKELGSRWRALGDKEKETWKNKPE